MRSMTKKMRFDVFKRDHFTCQYCGQKPPAVVLEVDHIHPVSNGGSNDIHNLLTACFDCNRGKSDRFLSSIPITVEQRAEVLREKEEQLKAYERLLKTIRRNAEKRVDQIEAHFQAYFEDRQFTDSFRKSVADFLGKLPIDVVQDAMSMACQRMDNPSDATKYFCGICWNKVREQSNGTR